ncbi:hypothetical protein [Amycolatopsis dendrobii]|uniref:Uncharacterized protein n=1 Tax=Amycolatopsis dendrobii TaxID=2760662 RepID=A0A7W3Z9S0_9PSEU|nr:hypothetical protein [Amycolatopsis dendrobii]MBB1153465.1 hypothetical protein [Amycolatopsis dendrobii]
MPDPRNWRLGTPYRIHGYAESPGSFDDEPIFTAMNRVIAEQIIEDHRGALAARREAEALAEKLRRADKDNAYLRSQLDAAKADTAKLRAEALSAVGTARRAHAVLDDLLRGHVRRLADSTDSESACE